MAAETVVEWLTRKELSTYAAAFEANGWDSLKQILALKEDEIQRLVNDVKMLSGHESRLRAALMPAQQQPQHSSQSSRRRSSQSSQSSCRRRSNPSTSRS